MQARQQGVSAAERKAQQRMQAWRAAYGLALFFLRPVVWIASGVLVLGDLYADARAVLQGPTHTRGRTHQQAALQDTLHNP